MSAQVSAQAPAMQAQAAGTISGNVLDNQGKPLGGARVYISGPRSIETRTKTDGTFTVDVPPGVYSVTISASGFQSRQLDSVAVIGGQAVKVAATLSNASLTTIARVSAGSATSVSDSPASNARLNPTLVQNQGQTQFVNVLDQVPGVEIFRSGGGSNEPGANTSLSIRGAQPYESQVLIDGHPVDTLGNGPFGFNTTFLNTFLFGGVEVSKGPGSMPNTVSDAVGGTVNFQTAPITGKPTGEFLSQSDSFGGWTYGVRFSDTFGKVGFLVGVARETTPGYMNPQLIYGANNFQQPQGIPVNPWPGATFGSGTAYQGVVNFAYPATSDFQDHSQLVKLSYSFSPVTSIQFTNFSTQTWLDETGNNVGNIYAKIVPCITTAGGTNPVGTTCSNLSPTDPNYYYQNYTGSQYLGLVGQTVPINYYAAYPNTYEFDNEPLYTADLRTVIGPGTFLARYYAGSITRNVIQGAAPYAISPCYTPSCAWVGTIPGAANVSSSIDNAYGGEPYYEETTDVLHGFDAQYTYPIGDNDMLTFGFDSHSDSALFQEQYALGYWPYDTNFSDYFQLSPGGNNYYQLKSTTESLRGSFMLTPKLQANVGGYFSNTTYIGSRFDPRVGLAYRPNRLFSIRASAGSAFVTPYYDLIQPTSEVKHSVFYPVSQYQPETSMSYDAGFDFKYERDSLFSADFYHTTVFNRYATITEPISGTYNGQNYGSIVAATSQGNEFMQGLELSALHDPRYGFGYRIEADLLRDYSYAQNANASTSDLFFQLPDNGVQLPGYPFSKARVDLTYAFHGGDKLRLSGTSYGANNAFGQSGFTTFDGAITLPVQRSITVTIGGTNIFNKDNGQTGGIYSGGYTFAALGGGIGPTNYEFAQPRTVFVQFSSSITR
jgi:outer membrane receptor protein involved in Fe transport